MRLKCSTTCAFWSIGNCALASCNLLFSVIFVTLVATFVATFVTFVATFVTFRRLINTFEKYFVDSLAKRAPKHSPPRPQTDEHRTSPVSADSSRPTLPRPRLVDPRLDPSRCVQARTTLSAPIVSDADKNDANFRFDRREDQRSHDFLATKRRLTQLNGIGEQRVADVHGTPSPAAADKENPLKRHRQISIAQPPRAAVPAKQAEQPNPSHRVVVRPSPLRERRKSTNDANRMKSMAAGTRINACQLYRCGGAKCQMAFASVTEFRKHVEQQHFLRDSEQYKCPHCARRFEWAVHSVDSVISHLHVTHWNVV